MIETKEEERTPLEYFITGIVILFFGGLYYFINHTGNDVASTPVQMVSADGQLNGQSSGASHALMAGAAGVASGDKAKTSTDDDTDEDGSTNAAEKSADAQNVVAGTNTDGVVDAVKQQQLAALAAEKSKLEGEISLLKADREKLVETNTSLMQDANAVMKQVAVAQQAALAETSPQANTTQQAVPKQAIKVAGYQLPDGTQVAISDEGFEGLLKQALEVRAINTPIIFDAIYFESGASSPTKDSQRQIEATAALMNGHPEMNVLIKGHTDNTGNTSSNTVLSLTRSGYMKNALVKLGIDARRINVEGVGSLEPIAPNDTEDGRNSNRRIELILTD